MKHLAHKEEVHLDIPNEHCKLCGGSGYVLFASLPTPCPCIQTHTYITRFYQDTNNNLSMEQEDNYDQ